MRSRLLRVPRAKPSRRDSDPIKLPYLREHASNVRSKRLKRLWRELCHERRRAHHAQQLGVWQDSLWEGQVALSPSLAHQVQPPPVPAPQGSVMPLPVMPLNLPQQLCTP